MIYYILFEFQCKLKMRLIEQERAISDPLLCMKVEVKI